MIGTFCIVNRTLRCKLPATNADGVHAQRFRRADLAHGTVADDEDLIRRNASLTLDLTEGRLLGHALGAVSVVDLFDRGLAVKAKRRDLCVLRLYIAEGRDEDTYSVFLQVVKQRECAAKRRQLPDRTIEIGIVRSAANCLGIGGAEMLDHGSVDVPQHGIGVKFAKARPVYLFDCAA